MNVNVIVIASLQAGNFFVHRGEHETKVLVPDDVSVELWRQIVSSLSTAEGEALNQRHLESA